MTTIALLGVGAMSSRLAVTLASHGHELVLWNRTPERAAARAKEHGWRSAESISEAVIDADVVLAVLRDDDASCAVWATALPAARTDSLCIDSSTLSPARSTEFVAEVTATGRVGAVAPMVGSLPQAEAGGLVFLAGGPGATAVAKLFDPVSAGVRALGSPHDAAVAKLVLNTALAVQTAMMAELDAVCEAAAEDPAAVIATVTELPLFSPTAKNMLGRMRSATYAPMFPVSLLEKDLDYLLGAADASGADPRVVQAVRARYAQAHAAGLEDLDLSAVRQIV